MQKFRLGAGGPLVSAQGLRCMGMSISYGEPDDDESMAMITGRRDEVLHAPIETIAVAHQCTAARVALASVHARASDIFPIPGTERRNCLEQNVAASSVSLTAEELSTLTRALAPGVTAGTRYPGKQLKSLGI